MFIPAQRQEKILQILRAEKTAVVSELSKRLEVSELTIRRDLAELSKTGLIERNFGGASLLKNLSLEPDYNTKASQFSSEKRAIGQKAAQIIDEGDTIFINSGSTTYEVIKAIIESNKKVTIITNNIGIFPLLNSDIKASIIFTGGLYRNMSHSVSGNLSLPIISEVYANKSFIGADGFSIDKGLTTPIQEEALTTKQMITRTVGKVYAVFTANKIGVVSNFQTAKTNEIDCIITNSKDGLKDSLNNTDVQAIFA